MNGAELHPVLYEVNTRTWLAQLRQSHGAAITLETVPEQELDYWSGLGFTHIWLMGVWTTGPGTQQLAREQPWLRARLKELLPAADESALGASPFAIQGYRVAADLGGNGALRSLRSRLNARGIKLILDFIPNHVGIDHPWLLSHPERFVLSPEARPGYVTVKTAKGTRHVAQGRDPYFPPWTDTLQLDYRKAGVRRAMSRELQKVVTLCDGVRCDMAMLVLEDVFVRTWGKLPEDQHADSQEEFWPGAIATAKEGHPELCMMAEVYWGLEGRLRDLGFDYTYDKELYDHLFAGRTEQVWRHIAGLSGSALGRGVHFLENHDEPRVARRLGLAEHRAAAVLMLSLPGMRFLHQGQLTGATEHVPVQFLRAPATLNAALRDFYEHLLRIIKSSVIGKGEWQIGIPKGPGQPLLITWSQGARRTLVLVNLSQEPAERLLPVSASETTPQLVDTLTGRIIPLRATPGGSLATTIQPVTAYIFELPLAK